MKLLHTVDCVAAGAGLPLLGEADDFLLDVLALLRVLLRMAQSAEEHQPVLIRNHNPRAALFPWQRGVGGVGFGRWGWEGSPKTTSGYQILPQHH